MGNSVVLDGYMDEVRISKGIARWTSSFTPPGIEYRQKHVFTANGNLKLDATTKKAGHGSIYLDGNDFDFGSGDFTIDAWLRLPDTSISTMFISQIYDMSIGPYWYLWYGTDNGLQFAAYDGSTEVTLMRVQAQVIAQTHGIILQL